MGWYYAVLNQRLGPVSDTDFAALVANGTITPATLVWREGLAGWLPYAQACGPGSAEDPDHAICAVSGRRYPKSQMLEYEGRWVSAEHREVFFQRLREGLSPAAGDAMPGPYGYGGFWIRFAARFIDGLLITVVGQITNGLLGLLFYSRFVWVAQPAQLDPKNMALFFAFTAATMLVGVGIGLSYEWYFLAKYQATLGKMALGLKVVRADGTRLSNGRIVGRHFSTMISQITLFIGYMMAGWDDEKRALHDRICDTRVVKTRA
ncbi:MAG: RDD family protein [Opitutaceae bacterium]|nr:RDD family protein [Opitutaceae bacterium]